MPDPSPHAESSAPRHPDWMESLYERLAEDDEGRVCKAISEDACRASPGNFFRTLVANTLSSLADRIASAKTTLPWLLLQLGAPGWMLSLLVPIRESGSMLPQMLIGAAVRRQPVRKWVWVWGGVLQGLCLLGMGWAALALEGAAAGWLVIALLVLFSLARGACSVAYKDVQGKTIPKTRRGRLSGWISAVSGLAALGVGLALGALQGEGSSGLFAGLLVGGAVLWFAAAAVFGRIVELPGATEGGANGVVEAFARLTLLRDDRPFRAFVIARAGHGLWACCALLRGAGARGVGRCPQPARRLHRRGGARRAAELATVGALGRPLQPQGVRRRVCAGRRADRGRGAVVMAADAGVGRELVLSARLLRSGARACRRAPGAQDLHGGHGRGQPAH